MQELPNLENSLRPDERERRIFGRRAEFGERLIAIGIVLSERTGHFREEAERGRRRGVLLL